jgi:U1 small nuclear ribonucleoprotein
MTDKLPPNLLALFAPRPPLRYLPPSDHSPEERRTANITGVAQYLSKLHEPHESEDYVPTESWLQRRDRQKLEKKERRQILLTDGFAECEEGPISSSATPYRLLHSEWHVANMYPFRDC